MAVVACRAGKTSGVLAERWRALGIPARLLTPSAATSELERGDAALVRLDVLRTLDGIEPGLDAVRELQDRGVRVLNTAAALACVHDKLATARALQAASLPAPDWSHLAGHHRAVRFDLPVVVKPRFGSWGLDVSLCETQAELDRCLLKAGQSSWFRRHGAMVEQYVASGGVDRRVLVAAGCVVGSIERVAAPGEWRTNVSLGGSKRPAPPAPDADALAVAAARACGIDFVGVDLIRSTQGWLVIELNGAVDFDAQYSLAGRDVFADIAGALGLLAPSSTFVPAEAASSP